MITQLQECFEEWLQIHDYDSDYSFYTPDEWSKRGEKYLCDSELIFAADNRLIELLNDGSIHGLEDELQDLAEGFGYYFEFGNHWNFGFYRRDGLPPLPATTASYSSLLADDRWQQKRALVAKRSGGACEDCGEKKSILDVHHCYYRYGRLPWQYPDAALLQLCNDCHKARQKAELKLSGFLPQLTAKEIGIIRKALRDGMYWYPRLEFWTFIESIGFDTDQMLISTSSLKPLRSHKDDREDKTT